MKQLPAHFYTLLNQHPYHPSLAAYADTFADLGIETSLLQIDMEALTPVLDTHEPFIASLQLQEGPAVPESLVLVQKTGADQVSYRHEGKTQHLTLAQFETQFNGKALLYFPEQPVAQAVAAVRARHRHLPTVVFAGALALLVVLGGIGTMAGSSPGPYFNGGVAVAIALGLVASVLLWLNEMQQATPWATALCQWAKSDCNALQQGNAAKAWGGISWASLGVAYFGAHALFVVLYPAGAQWPLLVLLVGSTLGILFSFYSFWYQARQGFCLLCTVAMVAHYGTLGGLLGGYGWQLPPALHPLGPQGLLGGVWLAIAALVLAGLLRLQQAQQRQQQQTKEGQIAQKLKYNTNTFEAIHQRLPDTPVPPLACTLNQAEPANDTLLLVTNPLCVPCHEQHDLLMRLCQGYYGAANIRLLFVTLPDNDNAGTQLATHLLGMYQQQPAQFAQAFDACYRLANSADQARWLQQYALPAPALAAAQQAIDAHRQWCMEQQVFNTPTVFFNCKRLNENYQLNDIKYFLK